MLSLAPLSYAQLIPIDEGELSNTTGQAFINIDQTSANGFDFTKLTLGLDIETSVNADKLQLGRYDRAGEVAGTSDIDLSNFALGTIDASGAIVPFEIKDPFIELAYEDNGGRQDLVGVRLGFGGAKGALSADINSLTGNVNVKIKDTASGLASSGNGLGQLAGAVLASNPIEGEAVLVDANGNLDPIRATMVGLPDGEKFNIYSGGAKGGYWSSWNTNAVALHAVTTLTFGSVSCGDSAALFLRWECYHATITSNDCKALGIATCFDLNKYKKLDVGKKQSDGTFDFANGMFVSFQSKTVTWKDGSTNTPAVSGAFMNIPNGGLEVTLAQAFNGTQRARTRYVDPYFGGW
jgi:hypothetical protein